MFQEDLKTNRSLRTEILKMIIFFDLFNSPLTSYEIWQHFNQQYKFKTIQQILKQETENFNSTEELSAQRIIQEKNGFYFLTGREEIIIIRRQRYNYFYRKLKIARRFTRFFSYLPFVQVVALANMLGSYNLRDGSDIDFFIITAPKRIWLSRLYCTGLAKLLNSRPNQRTKKDRICLSFYLSEEHLNLEDLHLTAVDPYFDYWQSGLFLLFNRSEVYQQFLQSKSKNLEKKEINSLKLTATRQQTVLDYLEQGAKKLQFLIMPKNLKLLMNNSDGVVVNDQVLKFYQHDRRQEFASRYAHKIQQLLETRD